MNSACDAVASLHVNFGHGKASTVNWGSLSDISGRSGIEHAAYYKSPHGFILGGQAAAVEAVNGLDTPATVRRFRAAMIAALGCHAILCKSIHKKYKTIFIEKYVKGKNKQKHYGSRNECISDRMVESLKVEEVSEKRVNCDLYSTFYQFACC